MRVKFKEWDCILEGDYYLNNNRKAIQLFSGDELHEPVATATVNIPEAFLEEDEVFIKDYSENEGMKDCLVYGRVIIDNPIRVVQSGFEKISAYQLTRKGMKLFQKKE